MKRLSLPLSTPFRRAALAVVLVALVLPGVCSDSAAAGENDSHGRSENDAHGRRGDKLDAHLRHALDHEGDWQSRRVIVRVDPKAIGSVQALMRARGDRTIRFHGGISAFTVRAHHLESFANNPAVLSISVDAPLDALQVAPPTAVLPTERVVRDSVSLPGAWTGAGIGVAVIDSGIEPSADFAGRITAFYDFT